jgi:chromosome partitioning protein
LEAVATTHDLAKLTRRRAVALVNGAHSRSDIAVSQAQRGLRETGLEVAPVTVHTRSIFAASLIGGRTAMEHEPDGKAAKEILALVKWLSAELDLGITAPPRNRFPAEPLVRRAA